LFIVIYYVTKLLKTLATSKTKNPTVARIANRIDCQRPLRSSKVNDFYLVCHGVCHFLLVINNNLGLISHRFRGTASFLLNFLLALHWTPNLKMFPLH